MPRDYEPLSAQDSSFLVFESGGAHMHVSAVALFENGPLADASGSLDIERIRRFVASRLPALPHYRQRLAWTPLQRHPVWVDDASFDLAYHVRHTALPAPGRERQLEELAGRILSQQLDRAKPLWELWFVEGLEGGRFAMLGKAHHCMVDGVAGVGVMTALLSAAPDEEVPPPPRWRPRPAPGRLVLARDELLRRARTPLRAWDLLRDAVRRPERASAAVAEGAESVWQALSAGLRTPADTPLNRPIGTHRRVAWRVLDLDAVKEVKKGLDGTVNDVVLAVVAGALRRHLRRRRVALGKLDFRVVIPVSMRRPGDRGSGNRVSALFLSLPLAERDPRRRFQRIRRETRRLKRSRAAEGIDLFARLADGLGSDWLTYWGVRLASAVRPYNLIVTNVPGPQRPLYLLGARLQELFPQLPLFERQGLGVAVMSYWGRVCFGLVADWDVVPDLGDLADDLDASFAELRRVAEGAGTR